MDKVKLKAIAFIIGSSVAGFSMANDSMVNKTTTDTQARETQVMQATQPGDATLTSDVNAALADYSGKVDVKIKNNIVYLSGELPSDTDYEKVITLVESTKGVDDVNVDALTVKDSQAPLYDTYLTAKVKGALIRDDVMGKDIPSWTVSVETKNNKVFLSGTVASEEEKQKVANIVTSVSGVKSVDNQITVGDAAPANGTNGTTGY